jgi:hypothetical protein
MVDVPMLIKEYGKIPQKFYSPHDCSKINGHDLE